jgi:hypothetical protein
MDFTVRGDTYHCVCSGYLLGRLGVYGEDVG